MYVIVLHELIDPPTAFARGEQLMRGDGAPEEVRVLQFFPSRQGDAVTCLWESPSLAAVQGYVDSTLGEASVNTCYEVDADQAFARAASGIATEPTVPA